MFQVAWSNVGGLDRLLHSGFAGCVLRWLLVISYDFKMFFAVLRLSCFRLLWFQYGVLGCSGCRRRLWVESKVWVGLTMFGSFTVFQVVLCFFTSFYVLWVVAGCSVFFGGRCFCYPKWFKFVRVVFVVQAVIGRRSSFGCIGMFMFVVLSCYFFTVHIALGCGKSFRRCEVVKIVLSSSRWCMLFCNFRADVLFFYHIKLSPLFQRSLNSLSCLECFWLIFV